MTDVENRSLREKKHATEKDDVGRMSPAARRRGRGEG